VAELAETVPVEDAQVDIVLSGHILKYLADPHSPAKTTDRDTVLAKAKEAVAEAYSIYKRKRCYFTGVAASASTKLNLVFSFKKSRVRHFELKVLTLEVKDLFAPADKRDVMVRVSKKTRMFKGRRALEIGPNIYTLDTSFEGADPYGLIQGILVEEIMARRGEFARDFCGTFDAAEGCIYCVATVDSLGTFFVDCAFWQPYGDFQTIKVR
jgi:hypothetical protein